MPYNWIPSYVYWGVVWLLLAFLTPELLAEFKVTPWLRTLSETVWHSERTYPYVASGLFATFVALSFHFFYRQDLWKAILVALPIAVAAHFIDQHL